MPKFRTDAFSQVTSDLQTLPIHPAFRLDLCEPVLNCGNSSQIFLDVLFSDVPHWDFLPVTVGDRDTEDLFAQEDTFRMMAKGAVTEVRKERLRLIKPIMNWQVVFGLPTESLRATLCMLQRVCHG